MLRVIMVSFQVDRQLTLAFAPISLFFLTPRTATSHQAADVAIPDAHRAHRPAFL